MLVIHPDECIDCSVCEPECPPGAIISDVEPEAEKWVNFNHYYAEQWPNITQKKDALEGAENRHDDTDKLKDFDPNPGTGDE